MFGFGTNVRKSIIHLFISHQLLINDKGIKDGLKEGRDGIYFNWLSPFHRVSLFHLRERCKELVQTAQYKAQTGNVIYPIDFNNVNQVRKYKSPLQLKEDRPAFHFIHGRMVAVWEAEELAKYGRNYTYNFDEIIAAHLFSGDEIAFETMYRKFTYDEVKVPQDVFDQMMVDNPGCFGEGHWAIPEVSQWAHEGTRNRRGESHFVKDRFL